MTHWGGAQWLIVFVLVTRLVIGLLACSKRFQQVEPAPPAIRYTAGRACDFALVLVLWWGGFW